MRICINDKIILIKFSNDLEFVEIKNRFTVTDKSYVFVGGTFDPKKIKQKCFLRKRKEFYWLNSGFLYDLLKFIKSKNFVIEELKDNRTKFEYQNKDYSYEELKSLLPDFDYVDHQIEALRAMLKTNIGIVQAPTSAGKTEIIISYLKASRLPTLILVNRVSLALQTMERINKNGIKAGICYGGGVKEGDVIVSTIGSVYKVPNLTKFKALMIDEVHRSQANQFQKFLSKTSYPIRFGFSATPNSGDEYKWNLIKQYLGNIIYTINPEPLMKHKVIAKPKIKFLEVSCFPTVDWPTANWTCIVTNRNRNNKIKDLIKEYKVPTLILIRNIDHGKELNNLIEGSEFVSGVDDAETRQKIIRRFEEGTLNTIISSNIFNEGISINRIKLLIIASGGKSKIETIQKLGRGLRVHEHKDSVHVFDFNDYGNYFTEKHSKMRKNIYRKAGFEVL
jgi:superfamily II DNA or RNA helicase